MTFFRKKTSLCPYERELLKNKIEWKSIPKLKKVRCELHYDYCDSMKFQIIVLMIIIRLKIKQNINVIHAAILFP